MSNFKRQVAASTVVRLSVVTMKSLAECCVQCPESHRVRHRPCIQTHPPSTLHRYTMIRRRQAIHNRQHQPSDSRPNPPDPLIPKIPSSHRESKTSRRIHRRAVIARYQPCRSEGDKPKGTADCERTHEHPKEFLLTWVEGNAEGEESVRAVSKRLRLKG